MLSARKVNVVGSLTYAGVRVYTNRFKVVVRACISNDYHYVQHSTVLHKLFCDGRVAAVFTRVGWLVGWFLLLHPFYLLSIFFFGLGY